jgi:excisionase family DNA binding protein
MERLLSVDEVVLMLGVSKATIYSWTSQNKIPHIKLSKRLLKFRENEIMDWISRKSINADTSPGNRMGKHISRHRSPSRLRKEGIERIIRNAKEEILNNG